jgi:hypothetical protein
MSTEQEIQDKIREKLSRMEDEVLKTLASLSQDAQGEGARWIAIGKTHIQEGFMAVKRGVYEGKRVGDT